MMKLGERKTEVFLPWNYMAADKGWMCKWGSFRVGGSTGRNNWIVQGREQEVVGPRQLVVVGMELRFKVYGKCHPEAYPIAFPVLLPSTLQPL
jgi:hypothetical protein